MTRENPNATSANCMDIWGRIATTKRVPTLNATDVESFIPS
jgi:hypothetical protein